MGKVLRADPSALDPLRGLDIDLKVMTDQQLHALTSALLEEKHRRAAIWLSLLPASETYAREALQ
jgi:hypothetical protein